MKLKHLKSDYLKMGKLCFPFTVKKKSKDIYKSKINGSAYVPESSIDEIKNRQLLIQLNFKDINSELLPKEGILQVWINRNEESLDSETTILKDRVIKYYDKLSKKNLAKNFLFYKDEFPLSKQELFLDFSEPQECYPNSNSNEINKFLSNLDISDSKKEKFLEYVDEEFSLCGCRVLGHPYFLNKDIRECEEYIQLIQIDSGKHLNFGDLGALKLLIKKEDLENRIFDNILIYLDSV